MKVQDITEFHLGSDGKDGKDASQKYKQPTEEKKRKIQRNKEPKAHSYASKIVVCGNLSEVLKPMNSDR